MDPELKEAACSGDVEFLTRAVASKPTDYFLSQYLEPSDPDETYLAGGNLFHIAAWRDKVEFFREALEILPTDVLQILLYQTDKDGWNLVHIATSADSDTVGYQLVQLIFGFYKSHTDPLNKPWLALFPDEDNSLHNALAKSYDETAMEILSMDMEFLCATEDKNGNSPLYLAIENGCNRVAENILKSSCLYSVSGPDGSTPLHLAPNSSEYVFRLLLEKHPDFMDTVDDKGFNVLHKWAELKEDWPLNLLLKGDFPAVRTKIFRDLIKSNTEKARGDIPLHTAARNENIGIAQAIVRGYQQEIGTMESLDCLPPWKIQNRNGDTPLHVALYSNREKLASHFLSLDSTLCQIHNNKGDSPLLLAVSSGCAQVVEQILTTHQHPRFSMLRRNDGLTVLHRLRFMPEKTGRRLLEKFWWMNNLSTDKKRTALDEAKEANIPWLVNSLMNPSLIHKEPFDWITACEKEETSAVLAFIDNCQDLQKVCREQNDTPLHHIKLQSYKDYLNFLKIPSIAELKNSTDYEGATPLHRALERKDMLLAKALLIDDGVERNIEDFNGTSTMNLLANLCKENDDWTRMCKQIKVNPYLKTTYIQSGTDLDQMRNTLSMVAALLATITFAAGFTLPGGLNSETGDAMLAKKPSFLVFLLADVYAMCTSMLVLFCLIWSMVSNRDMSYLLVDRSVVILMQSLYSTMVAFMTGIYTVIEHSSLWAAIIIFVMCSFIGISANRIVLHNILSKLIPAANQDQRDRARLLEEGKAFASRIGSSQKAEEAGSNSLQNTTSSEGEEKLTLEGHEHSEDQIPLLETGNAKVDFKNAEGTSSNPLQKSKSFAKEKKFVSAGHQDLQNQLPSLEENKTFTSENDDSHASEGTSSKPLEYSTSFAKKKKLVPVGNQ